MRLVILAIACSFLVQACGGSDTPSTILPPPGDDDAGAVPAWDGGEPLDAPIPNCAPTVPASTGDVYEDCVNRINQFRKECQNLPPLGRWKAGEDCADQHAEYDSTRTYHAGFKAKICTNGGWAQNECPARPGTDEIISGCLQQMWDEGPGEDFEAHGHYINMSSEQYTHVACGFYTMPNGDVWSTQNFFK